MAKVAGPSNRLRIIGGQWRGHHLNFIPNEGLRPTPDRVRETLFNWLAPIIHGARCLDLFAGSGALGIEALSRSAAEVIFVEQNPAAARRLRENLALLGVNPYQVKHADALSWLKARAQIFDVIFADPPFGQNLLPTVCALLENSGWLAPQARVYLESERGLKNLELPPNWQIIREKLAGEVAYRLALRESPS